jgi:predicted O-methyltransferase YrrM
MPLLDKLHALYRSGGHTIVNGVPPLFSGLPYTEFTYVLAENRQSTGALGIAPAEVYLLEHLLRDHPPRTALVIGNSFGWSTLAIGLIVPSTQVLAIDSAPNPFLEYWIEETNRLAAVAGVRVHAQKGSSPEDVPTTLAALDVKQLDFVFVDGLHTNDQLILDVRSVMPYLDQKSVVLLHDVEYWNLHEAVSVISRETGLDAHLLLRTPSGVVVLCRDNVRSDLVEAITAFEIPLESAPIFRQLADGKSVDGSLDTSAPSPQGQRWIRALASGRDGNQVHVQREMSQLRADFDALLEDRKKAQEIMEHQGREIATLRARLGEEP